MVQVNLVGAPSSPQQLQQPVTTRSVPHSLSSIVSVKGEGGGLLSSIWSGIKTVFSTIFCCYSCSDDVETTSPEQLKVMKKSFTVLHGEFLANKGKMTVENFKAWWTPKFEALSEGAQHLIMVEDMKGWARTNLQKKLQGSEIVTEDMVTQHAKALCLEEGNRTKSLAFIRDLKIAVSGRDYDPMHDNFLPTYFSNIVEHLTAQIKEQTAE